MRSCLSQERIKKITSPNGEYVCYLHEEYQVKQMPWDHQKASLYRVNKNDLIHLKTLFGNGIFLDNNTLLLFIDSSGYGHCEGDCYLYEISSDKIYTLYDDNFNSLCNEYCKIGSRGAFVSLSSNILVTLNFLIIKSLENEIYFYNCHDITTSKKLEIIYRLPFLTDEEEPIDELIGFEEKTNIFEYSAYGKIIRKEINFKKKYPINRESVGLDISCKLYKGCAIDYNTILSSIQPDGNIETQKTELGEYMYQLKYNSNETVVSKIAQKVKTEYFNMSPAIGSPLETSPQSRSGFFLYEFYSGEKIDILIPIPSSNPQKNDPLEDLWNKISQLTKIPIDTKYLIKNRITTQIKSIDDKKKRENILMDSLSVIDKRYQNKNVMLLDDTYCSGATINVAATILKELGKVNKIYALTMLKIRGNSNLNFKG